MNSKLKPCPFCGASYDKDEDDFVYAADHENWCPLRGMAYGGYGLTVGDTEEEIDAWNTRSEYTCRKVPGRMKYGRRMPACSECGYSLGDDRWFFCPKCGARMVE